MFTDLEIVNEKLKTINSSFNDYMFLSRKIKKYYKDYRLQYLYNCITGCTLMSKKKYLEKIIPIPMDSKYVIHDTWIGLIVALNGKIAYLDEATIKYRQHGNNQVGSNHTSHKYTKLNQVRELFIDVKYQLFNTYINNSSIFTKDLQKQNEKALKYFKMLKNKKYINFRGWNVFYKLYKTETFKYYIENFIILNLPILASIPFKLRRLILKNKI